MSSDNLRYQYDETTKAIVRWQNEQATKPAGERDEKLSSVLYNISLLFGTLEDYVTQEDEPAPPSAPQSRAVTPTPITIYLNSKQLAQVIARELPGVVHRHADDNY